MSKKKATSSDVAKRAGVSQATVSMVLNKKYNVSFSRETVEKVEQAARELGYHLPGRKNRKESRKAEKKLADAKEEIADGEKEQKRKSEREADRCFLPYAYKPVLCIASAGD